jgi:GH15 family glucan-1,4-alpha-glucosidase
MVSNTTSTTYPWLTIIDPDMSIWEVRNNKQHFTYSQIMLWVAFDRGLRLADKRCFPCPNRSKWMEARDNLYERIMEKGNALSNTKSTLLTACRIQRGYEMLRTEF